MGKLLIKSGVAPEPEPEPGPPWDFSYLKNDATDRYPTPHAAKPAYGTGVPYYDPDFDPDSRCPIYRISGDNGDTIIGSGRWGLVNRTHYSTDCPFNADQTMIFLDTISGGLGSGNRCIISAVPPFAPISMTTGIPSGGEVRWHPTDPALMIYASGSIFGTWNPISGTTATIRDFTADGFSSLAFNGKGKLSWDNTKILLTGTHGGVEKCFIYDFANNIKSDNIVVPNLSGASSTVGRMSISASGLYAIIGYENGTWNEYDYVFEPGATVVGDAILTMNANSLSHYDQMLDAAGNDLVIGRARGTPQTAGQVYKVNLNTPPTIGTHVNIQTRTGFQAHTSCQDKTSAWVCASFPPPAVGEGTRLYQDELVLMRPEPEVGENRRVTRMHAPVSATTGGYLYDCEPQPVQSQDGGMIIWHCNWEIRGDTTPAAADSFLIDLRNLV